MSNENGATKQENAHALIGPSSFARVITCPASALIGVHLPRTSSAAADAGSALHNQAEAILRQFDETAVLPSFVGLDDQVLAYVIYTTYRMNGLYGIEDRVHLDTISGGLLPFFGTIDFWAFDADTGHLEVVDLKTGSMPVVPNDNAQLNLYAIGVRQMIEAEAVCGPGAVRSITLTIHQGGYADSCRITPERLDQHAEAYRAAFKAAISPVARFSTPGDHCRWCPGKALCPAQEAQLQDALTGGQALDQITGDRAPTAGRMMLLAQQAVEVLDAAKTIVQADFDATGTLPPGITAKSYQPPAKWVDAKAALQYIMTTCADPVGRGLIAPANPTIVQKAAGPLPMLVERDLPRLTVRVAK